METNTAVQHSDVTSLLATRAPKEQDLITRAYNLSNKWLTAQDFTLVKALHDLAMDGISLAAALCYCASRNSKLPHSMIEQQLGGEVAGIVAGVLQIEHDDQELSKLREILMAMIDDPRVIIIKLAECLCALRASSQLTASEQRSYALIARNAYVPVANRLGIGNIKWELEDLVFKTLEPVAYNNVAGLLNEKQSDRNEYIEKSIAVLQKALSMEGVKAVISGRSKHIYSIWQKMQRKQVSYYEIYDKRAVRILVPETTDCYAALGVVHSLWQHIPHEFDDYIATPKENGYRSLHTAVIGAAGKTIEVQIRTQSMHNQAYLGVTAHWRYKNSLQDYNDHSPAIKNLRHILHCEHELPPQDAANTLKQEFFSDKLQLFTPKGKVIELPQGATVLDFAYHVGVELGHAASTAKLNGIIVPLTTKVRHSARIEILASGETIPDRKWLNPELKFITTALAKSSVIHWFKQQTDAHNIALGSKVVANTRCLLDLSSVNNDMLLDKFPAYNNYNDLLIAVAIGDVTTCNLLLAMQQLTDPLPLTNNVPATTDVNIDGAGSMPCYIAACCAPSVGDTIAGCIEKPGEVMVHKADCSNALKNTKNGNVDLIAVSWGKKVYNPYAVSIVVKAYDRPGLLMELCDILSCADANMIHLKAVTDKSSNSTNFLFNIEISGMAALSAILIRASAVPNVVLSQRMRLQD